jgi:hypothetical protein
MFTLGAINKDYEENPVHSGQGLVANESDQINVRVLKLFVAHD